MTRDTSFNYQKVLLRNHFEYAQVLHGDALAAQTLQRRGEGIEFLLDAHGEKPVRNLRYLEFDEEFAVSDLRLKFLDARGHDPYHGAFFEPERGWLFSGDVVIATPTPISVPMNDDLDLYMASLDRLAAVPTELLLPGHGVQRSGDLTAVYARSRSYQQAYRDQLMQLLDMSTEPLGLLAIGLRSTPDGKPYEGGARWYVHLALIDSHLRKLVREELVERVDGPRYLLA